MNVATLINEAFGQQNENKIDFKLMRYILLLLASNLRILELNVQITDDTDSFKIQTEREIRDHFFYPERKTTRYVKHGYNKVKRNSEASEDVHVIAKKGYNIKSNKLLPDIMLKKLVKEKKYFKKNVNDNVDKKSAKNTNLKETQRLKQKQQLRQKKEQNSFITDMEPYKMKSLSLNGGKDPKYKEFRHRSSLDDETNKTNTKYKQSLQRYGKDKLEETHKSKEKTVAEEIKMTNSEMIANQSDKTKERYTRMIEDKKHKIMFNSSNSKNQLEEDIEKYDENNDFDIGLQKILRKKERLISKRDNTKVLNSNYRDYDVKIDSKQHQLRNADMQQIMDERKIIDSGSYDQQLIKNVHGKQTEDETAKYNENDEIQNNVGLEKTLRKTGQLIYGKDFTRIYKNDDLQKTLQSRKGDTTKIMGDKSATDDTNTSKSRDSSINLKGSIQIVTRSQFEILKSAVEQLERNIRPISMPTVPSDEKLKNDVLNGKTKLSTTMIAIQLNSRIQAIENMSKRLKEIIRTMVKLGILTEDVIKLIDEEPNIEVNVDEILPTTKINQSSPSKILNMNVIRDITNREMMLYLEATKNNVLKKIIKYLSLTNKNSMSAGERIINFGGRLRNVEKYADQELILRDKIYYSDEVLNFFRKGIGPEIEECKRELNSHYEDVQTCIRNFKDSLGKVSDSVAVSSMKERLHALNKKLITSCNRHEDMVKQNKKLYDDFQVLLKLAFTMQSQKADIEEMNDTMNDKVDKEVLRGLLVTKGTYDNTKKGIRAKFHSLNDINLRHDQRLRVAYNDLSNIMLTKADYGNFDQWKTENSNSFEEMDRKIYNLSMKCAIPEAAVVTIPQLKFMDGEKSREPADITKKNHQNIASNCICYGTDSIDNSDSLRNIASFVVKSMTLRAKPDPNLGTFEQSN